ncbi:hypothetical protein M5K25_023345 [Dendrobium thyrsiflorum]|uniref:Replication factor C subunit 1 n=1 Tax=Dendrobium thyrsiflorum TaxID=117978 RepID=A0ABD0U8J6_DENTH
MAAKKVDALEERLEGEMNQIKETVEERISSMEGQVTDLRDMMKMLEFQTQSPASDAKGPEAKNTNSEIHREEEVEFVEGRRGRPHLEAFQREERGGRNGERQGYGDLARNYLKLSISYHYVKEDEGNFQRRKTSKYFAVASDAEKKSTPIVKDETAAEKASSKRKNQKGGDNIHNEVKQSPAKRFRKVDAAADDDFEPSREKKKLTDTKPLKNLKSNATGQMKKSVDGDKSDEGDNNDKDAETPVKGGGRGRGGSGSASAIGGRGGRGGRGGFMNFGERKDPPHKGEKEVPEGAPDCLAGLTFVISGTLDSWFMWSNFSLEREEAEDLIKRHGGRVTGSVSKKTTYLLADEDIGGKKSEKAKELGTAFLTEDGLFDMIRKSKPAKPSGQNDARSKTPVKKDKLLEKDCLVKQGLKGIEPSLGIKKSAAKDVQSSISHQKRKVKAGDSLMWTEKYRPKVPNDIIGNQSLVKQLHDWLANWHTEFLHAGKKTKGKKQSDSAAKKAVLISGTPGIGKSTSAKLVSQMLGYNVIEVNASDSRGKADAKIVKGVGGSTSNSIKELIDNKSLSINKNRSKHPKMVLIMDEVDGMSAGDRGGVADLISSIKVAKIPIICICNDRYSQKLKSLVNYCMLLNFRKPTKQQMAKRLMQVAQAEGLQVNEIALEELAERVNGDMRMALNQLQYMSLSLSVIKYDDVRERLLSSAKDEDISPFTAVDKLFDFKGGKLRMDERIELSMSDPDLVPLIVQENYINYRPSLAGKDENGLKRMNLIAQAAESIGDGDIFNVQIRRYRQWQLSQAGSFASTIIPAALIHGNRETLEPAPIRAMRIAVFPHEVGIARMILLFWCDVGTLPGRMEVVVVVKDHEEDMSIAYDSQRVDTHDFSANNRANNDVIVDGMSDDFFAGHDLEENSLCVGSRFEDSLCFKQAIRSNAILHNFAIKIKASDKSRVIATCTYRGCPWRIRASLCLDGHFFEGERNFNRFGGWLGKNSTMGKNLRLLEDVHIHILASQTSNLDRQTLRIDYLYLLLKQLTDPLRVMAKDAAVQNVVEFMNTYSLSQEDFETILELSKFKGHPNPMDGIQPAVKAALTKAYKQGSSTRIVRTADLINLPGIKKAPKKRIAAILEPVENSMAEENGDALLENEEGSDSEEADVIDQVGETRPQLDLHTDNRKGIHVQLDLKIEDGKSNSKNTSTSKASGSGSSGKVGRGGSAAGKRKR